MTPQPFSCYNPPSAGTPHGKILIVGEAPGEDEERLGVPFIGPAGNLFSRIARDAGFLYEFRYHREGRLRNQYGRFDLASEFHVTNVFSSRPPSNDLLQWGATKIEIKRMDRNYNQEKMPNGKYLRPEFLGHIARLRKEVAVLQPDLIIGLGAVALWGLTGKEAKIGSSRGVFLDLPAGKGIFTFHPANILRQYENYPIAWRDLTKARMWLNGELRPPLTRRLCINPTWAEMEEHWHTFRLQPERHLGVDIETDPRIGQITTIAFGLPELAICIPFYDKRTLASKCNHWPTLEEELRAFSYVKRFAALPNPKVFQNGNYDIQYCLDTWGLRFANAIDDTLVMAHATQPELKRGLDTLASLQLNEPLWKYLNKKSGEDNKADD